MKLYSFHKKVRPVTDYLNLHHVPFKFKSVHRTHCLQVPIFWPSSVEGWYIHPTTAFSLLVKSCGLQVVKEYDYYLVF